MFRTVSGRAVVLPLSAANYPAVIDQFDSDVDSFQFGDVFALVPGAIVSDRGATIRIRNHYHRSRRLIAGKDLTGFVVVALDPREFPQVNLCQIIHGALWRPPRKIADIVAEWTPYAYLGPFCVVRDRARLELHDDVVS